MAQGRSWHGEEHVLSLLMHRSGWRGPEKFWKRLDLGIVVSAKTWELEGRQEGVSPGFWAKLNLVAVA